MKIGLISDTHSFLDPAVASHFADCDEIWHAGDIGDLAVADALLQLKKPFRAVYGNIDSMEARQRFPENDVFVCEGVKVWMTHIGGFPPKYTTKLKKQLAQLEPDLFICGHSHILRIIGDPDRSLLHVNPGAAGHEGFHQIRTIVILQLADGRITGAKVVELGKRGRL